MRNFLAQRLYALLVDLRSPLRAKWFKRSNRRILRAIYWLEGDR